MDVGVSVHSVAALRLSTATQAAPNDRRLDGLFVRCPLSAQVQPTTFSNGAVWLDYCRLARCWVLRYFVFSRSSVSVAWGRCTEQTEATRLPRSSVWEVMSPVYSNHERDFLSTSVALAVTPVERATEAVMSWARNVTALHISSFAFAPAYEFTARVAPRHTVQLTQRGDLLCIACATSSAAATVAAVGGVYCRELETHVIPVSLAAETVAQLLEYKTMRLVHNGKELPFRRADDDGHDWCGSVSGIYSPTYFRGAVLRSNYGFPIYTSKNEDHTICYSPTAKAFEVRARTSNSEWPRPYQLLAVSDTLWDGRVPCGGDICFGRVRLRCEALLDYPRRILGQVAAGGLPQ
jgi:hypothetical protein